jgi:hypothetical protein
MPVLTIEQLIKAVEATYEVDESGDANLLDFLLAERFSEDTSLREFLDGFLQWANGVDWLTSDLEDNVRIRQLAGI